MSQNTGLVVLLPKVNKPKKIEDYRSLTLLNCDLKIATRAVTARLSDGVLLEKLMHPMEVRRGAARNINVALCDLRDLINCYLMREKKGCLIALDFNGAFNAIRQDYILTVLEKKGLSDEVLKLFTTLTKAARSRIQMNGELTSGFRIGRSVRQGCPLSAVLFSIALSPLITILHSKLEGMRISRCVFSVSSYADDVVVTLRTQAGGDHDI